MILVDENTRVVVQGITGGQGSYHARASLEYGTKVVAGATPGKGGTLFDDKIPVFNRVEDAVKETGANASLIFVPAAFAADAILESADAGIPIIVCITEGLPALDELVVNRHLAGKGACLIGPNCPGITSPPGRCRLGIMPGYIHKPGNVGVVSRSGTLTYEAVNQLTELGIGQSTVVGIGGDPLPGSTFVDILKLFQADPDTNAVILIGEIGGTNEQAAAEYIKSKMTKPVVGFIAGATAPPGRRMGHAGAIVTGSASRADEKKKALAAAGVAVVESPAEIGITMQRALKAKGLI